VPTNTPIPTKAVNAVLSSPEWNYLTPLNTNVALLSGQGALTGTLPSFTAPNFQIIAGRASVSPASGNFSFTFPGGGFPNGLLCVLMQPEDTSGTQSTIDVSSVSTKTTGVGVWWRPSGTGFTGGPIVLNYIAIGF
jgi:hypothetical protein